MKANMLKLKKLIRYFPVLPFAGINNERNYSYIENLVGYIDRIINSGSAGIFIAMDTGCVSTTELVKYFAEAMNRKIILFRLPGFFLTSMKYFFPVNFERLYGSLRLDNYYTRQMLGFKPSFSTREGIARTIIQEL
jgi:UDP-glucose 4-epimerase